MQILLISANTETINMPVLPLGMASIAAMIEQAGHAVLPLNLLERNDPRLSLQKAISEIRPDVIGISVRNIDDQSMDAPRFLLDPVKSLVAACRELSVAPVVLGGAGYSIFPQSALAFTGADYGIQGEGEEAFPLLLEFLKAKRNPVCIPGVYARDLQKENPPCFSLDLNRFPLPLPNLHLEVPESVKKEELWLPYQTRRGCPMACSYCSTPIIEGKNIRSHDIDRVVDNITRYTEAGINRFFFVDNTFNIPASYAERLCDALIDAALEIKWRCIVYPWKIDDSLAGKMVRAGCEEVSFGFESGSARVLEQLNKKYSPEAAREISFTLKYHGIRQMGFLLLGGPGETRETVLETLDFADGLPLDALKITTGIRIYPGTPLAAEAVNKGFISPTNNLLEPRFYLEPELSSWLLPYMAHWAGQRAHCLY